MLQVISAIIMLPPPSVIAPSSSLLSRCLWRTTCATLASSSSSSSSASSEASPSSSPSPPATFASLLRNSKFVQMGDPVGKVVVGKIYHVVNDDLYIDFGGKFPAVCQRQRAFRSKYVRGAEVRLLVKKLELSEKFLGYDR